MTLFLPLLLVLWGLPQAMAAEYECDHARFGVEIVEFCPPYSMRSFHDERSLWDKILSRPYRAARITAIPAPDIDKESTDCLAQMEAAMKAMDKSIPQFFRKMILSGRTYWEFTDQDGSGFTMTEAQAKAYWEMLDQWELAKACWQKETP